MNTEVYQISDFHLALSVILVIIVGVISAFLRLGLLKSLVWGTIRTFTQLILAGYVLVWIFKVNSPYLLIGVLLVMCFFGTRTAVKQTKNVVHYPAVMAYISLAVSTFLVTFVVTELVISVDKWYDAWVVIPIAGMVLGNSMTGIALALDRLYAEVRSNSGEIEAMLSLGATPWEAVRWRLKESLRAGMMPTINTMMVVGIVKLPGMMTGQILGGVNPILAVRYQIVVLLMVTAAAAMGALMMLLFSYRRLFNAEGALLPELLASGRRD